MNNGVVLAMEHVVQEHLGCELLGAMYGKQGIEEARRHRPDLIMLDLHLPDMHGSEVLDKLRSDPVTRSIPVVVVSADATPKQIRRLKEQGAQAYLTKPLDVPELVETVHKILGEVNGAA